MEVFIGAAAGIIAAAACALFYRKGVSDGMRYKKTAGLPGEGGEDKGSELMRKYELIMGYDPYGTSGIQEAPRSDYGDRV